VSARYDYTWGFSEGLAFAYLDGKCGFIDRTGGAVIPFNFDECSSFVEGLAPVRIGKRWGYIDNSGKFEIRPQFEDAVSFSEGMAAVEREEKWGYLDSQYHRFAIEPKFAMTKVLPYISFSEGKACVQQGSRWGFIDQTGKFVIPPKFIRWSTFHYGLAKVCERPDHCGYIDEKGVYVWLDQR